MFKNIIFYTLENFDTNDEALTQVLQMTPFEPCAKFELKSVGWVAPAGGDTEFVRTSNGATLIALCTEKKKIPSSAVKAAVAEKVEAHEARHSEKPSKKDIRSMKEDVMLELTPRAFSAQETIKILFSADRKWLAVDASSTKKAEDVLAQLRHDLGSLKVKPFNPANPVEPILTNWLMSQELPEKIELVGDCTLDDNDGGVVTCKNLDLFSDEVANHLRSGKTVTKLALNHFNRIAFTLDNKLILKAIKYDQSMAPEHDDQEEDEDAQMAYLIDGWMVTLAPELSEVFDFLSEQFM